MTDKFNDLCGFFEVEVSGIREPVTAFGRSELTDRLLKLVPDLEQVDVDYLMNMKYDLYDLCVWFDAKTSITVIYTWAGSSFEDSQFSICLEGRRLRELFPRKGKYNEGLSYSDVESMFQQCLTALK